MSPRSLLMSSRFWAMAMVLTALFWMFGRGTAEATCGPCGAAQCIFNGSCYGQGTSWCAPWNIRYSCEFIGGNCPTVIAGSQCGS